MAGRGLRIVGGIIDPAYRGEIVVMAVNGGPETITFERGDRIAQLLVLPRLDVSVVQVESLGESERGAGGFGSTGR